jgi:hypothetical protein
MCMCVFYRYIHIVYRRRNRHVQTALPQCAAHALKFWALKFYLEWALKFYLEIRIVGPGFLAVVIPGVGTQVVGDPGFLQYLFRALEPRL